MERWKDVPGYEGYYKVSNIGNVKSISRKWSIKERILSATDDSYGYLHVSLRRDNKGKSFKVHRLVMLAFIGEKTDGLQINHINGVKTDNNLKNLEYCTPLENTRHYIEVLKNKTRIGGV